MYRLADETLELGFRQTVGLFEDFFRLNRAGLSGGS
jgi:hypothetical protein